MAETPSTRGDAAKPLTLEDVQRLLDQQLGDAHIQRRGLSTGVIKDGEFRGRHDEQMRFISGMVGAGPAVVTVPHDLGRVPGYVHFSGATGPVGVPPVHITIAEVDFDRWTDTTARVEVKLQGAGGLDGVIVKVFVGGERG